tara:strand:+ start:271 stop:504 length:234 start_codon:yes stop_codon:yes gene_type:complete
MTTENYEIANEEFVALPDVHKFMRALGIKRGFSRSNILVLMKKGELDIEFVPQGQQKYFKAEDLRSWWNGRCSNYKI